MAKIADTENMVGELQEPLEYYKDDDNEGTEVTEKTSFKDFLDGLNGERGVIAEMFEGIIAECFDLRNEIDRMKTHRHDTRKTYSGRPEL